MDFLSREELSTLIGDHKEPCVSIYMPTVRAGAEIQQNPIRLKNLLRSAEMKLGESGIHKSDAKSFLESAWDMVNNEVYWQNQSDGLAVFLAPGFFATYRLPLDFEEMVVVSDHFHIKPLLPVFSENERFYILALSQNEVRLLEGTRYSVDELELDEVPKNLNEALAWDDPEDHLTYHQTGGAPTGGAQPRGEFHGRGVGSDDEIYKTNILRYFHQVDDGLQNVLRNERAPMVLAGVEYLFPIFKEASSYQYILENGIPGNPDEMKAKDLHAKARELVKSYFKEEQKDAARLYQQQMGMKTGKTSKDLEEIIPAAFGGRIGTFFVTSGVERWGEYDWANQEIKFHEEPSYESQDLLDLVAAQTILNDGEVYIVEVAELPDESPFAAVFRY